MASSGKQFLLLLWKNWVLHKRKHWLLIVLQFGMPVFFSLLLVFIRFAVDFTDYPTPRAWESFDVDTFNPLPPRNNTVWRLAFTPDVPATQQVMALVGNKTGVISVGYDSIERIIEALTSDNATDTAWLTWGGIEFTSSFPSNGSLPKAMTYSIRPSPRAADKLLEGQSTGGGQEGWRTEKMFPEFQIPGPRNADKIKGGFPFYAVSGFLALQKAIDMSIIETWNNSADLAEVAVRLQRFPYPPYVDDIFLIVLQTNLPFLILLSFIVTVPQITKDIVLEKERRLKEYMKVMGLGGWMHWLAWFIKYFIQIVVVTILMTIFYCANFPQGAIFRNSDPTLIFFFLLIYAINCITFGFLVSCLCKKASSAAGAGGVLFFLSYIPYTFIQNDAASLAAGLKWGLSIFGNVAMSFGCIIISQYEGTGAGLKWSNFSKPVSVDGSFTMGDVLLMLVLDSAIYMLLCLYIDSVRPGDYGLPKPWYFPCTGEFWCGSRGKVADEENLESIAEQDPEFFERTPSNVKSGIRISNLRREFNKGKKKKIAVAGTNLEIFEGQITALLGHNGAGKTTTMSMLTGFIPPSSGTAYVNGHDIRRDMGKIRGSLGLCPQHDVLFDTLTVAEHLRFFGQLKGISSSDIDREVDTMFDILKLEDKKNEKASTLSGGMKRKLSMGIALIGGSKTVILDEPTSGMDPEARRQTWDILQGQRQGRTIILSTHFMDEADLLGDRIAIMAEGVVQCCGTSLFLKKKYGVGYHLVMVKNKSCVPDKVTEAIQSYVPSANKESDISAELSYILPSDASAQFEALFTFLEENKQQMGIESFGASVTTMEEVFMRVGEEAEARALAQNGQTNGVTNGMSNQGFIEETPAATASNGRELPQQPKVEKCTGMSLYSQQFKAMFIKRIIHTVRNRMVTFNQTIIPVILVILAGLSVKNIAQSADSQERDPMKLSLDSLTDQKVAYMTDSAFEADKVSSLVDGMKNYLSNNLGVVSSVTNVNGLADYSSDPNLTRYIGEVGESNMDEYSRNYMFASEIFGEDSSTANSSVTVTGLFNNQAFHTIGIALSSVSNILVKYFVGNEYSIETTNHPLPQTKDDSIEDQLATASTTAFILSSNMMFGMAFLVSSFAVFLIKEREIKAKHIQFVSGVPVANFWLATYAWDIINYMIPAVLIIIVMMVFNIEGYTEQGLFYFFLVLLFYGWAVVPSVYLFSFLFTVPSSGYTWITIFNFITGIGTTITVFILKIPAIGQVPIGEMLEWVFYILFPNFGFGTGIQEIYNNYQTKKICTTSLSADMLTQFCMFLSLDPEATNPCCPDICDRDVSGAYCATYQDNYLAWDAPGLGRPLLFMFLQGIIFLIFVFIVESGGFSSFIQRVVEGATSATRTNANIMMTSQSFTGEDDDVKAERLRIANTELGALKKDNSVILMDIKKYYQQNLAVNRLSVGIPEGECFGLLGVNGAGKTTTFKMMTGDIALSSGDAFLNGFSVKRDIKQVQRQLGYCPQFDALIDQMTVTETLAMYARLRGVKESQVDDVVKYTAMAVNVDPHLDKKAKDLSGGNKRKLSTAIALIGDPQVVFLDEPTTGMDPVARRTLWDTLSRARDDGRTLVLTSHSMEECEALCTRLAIMVNGQFKCLGGTQHLKTKFGEGYTLIAKLGGVDEATVDDNTRHLMAYIEELFPGSSLKDTHHGYIHYQIRSEGLGWGTLFGTMERAKEKYSIDDYSVSQTSLEQVFLNFARTQREPKEAAIGCGVKFKNCCCFFCCCGCCKSSAAPIDDDQEQII